MGWTMPVLPGKCPWVRPIFLPSHSQTMQMPQLGHHFLQCTKPAGDSSVHSIALDLSTVRSYSLNCPHWQDSQLQPILLGVAQLWGYFGENVDIRWTSGLEIKQGIERSGRHPVRPECLQRWSQLESMARSWFHCLKIRHCTDLLAAKRVGSVQSSHPKKNRRLR